MENVLKDYIENEILNNNRQLSVDDELLISGLLDSMSVMRVIGYIQSEFEIVVPAQDVTIEHFSSIACICQYLTSRQNNH